MYEAEIISTGYVNVRIGPGKEHEVIYKVYPEMTIKVLDDTDPVWWKISTFDGVGYIMSQYVM